MEYDGLIRYRSVFNRERLLVASPRGLADVLVSKSYDFRKPAAGDEHQAERRSLLPAFQFRHVKNLYPIFWAKAGEVVAAMTAACGVERSAVLEVNWWAMRCTLDIMGVAGIGVDFGAIPDEDEALMPAYVSLSTPSPEARLLMLLGTFLPGWLVWRLPLRRNSVVDEAARRIRNVSRDLIRDKRARLEAGDDDTAEDMLSVMLSSGRLTDEGLTDQLMTLLAAGTRHDGVGPHLGRLPAGTAPGQAGPSAGRGAGEAAVGGRGGGGGDEQRRGRDALPPSRLQRGASNGHAVPDGTWVMLSPWATNVNSRLWGPDATEFKPERWLDSDIGDGGAGSNYAFMTFLHGPRSCIGASFARAELACLVAAWTGRFALELADEALMDERRLEFKTAVTARPARGMHLLLSVVEGW
ncbi:hypothetical protein XA68_18260 [Ophiocordyceps unilateralis]|uniref:Cytochrome P450 n=1 Tax=Ophiocordyceps unilateralis TaxID=268505 RepID=A0A2A9P3B1_OPHUN|nr:hypothetical protein XA68_18260 [Ophiocordyceps unilateralis]